MRSLNPLRMMRGSELDSQVFVSNNGDAELLEDEEEVGGEDAPKSLLQKEWVRFPGKKNSTEILENAFAAFLAGNTNPFRCVFWLF